MTIRAVIVDDEPLAIEALERFCERSGRVEIHGAATDGAAGLDLARQIAPDLVFLDIGMPGLGGLDVAAGLHRTARAPLVVFVTAFDHFATQAYDLSVADYLLKPLEPLRFERAVDRVEQRLDWSAPSRAPEDLWVPSRGGMVRISIADIRRVDAERDYVRLSVGDRSHLLRENISAMAERLDASAFVRIHRSTILRIDMVKGLRHLGGGAWATVDACGQEVRIGRSHLARVREQLGLNA